MGKINYIKDIYKIAKRLNIEIDFRESDLYLIKNELTRKMIDKLEFKENVTSFFDGNKWWYEIPFAYTPFWRKIGRK